MPEEYRQEIIDNADRFLDNENPPEWVKDPEYIQTFEDDGKPKIARNVWSIQRLTEIPPSTLCPWRKIFRFTAEEFWGIFYPDGSLVPGQPFFRRVYHGMRGMLSDQGRLMILFPALNQPPPRKAIRINEVCLNTVHAIINEFYKRPYKVSMKLVKGEREKDRRYVDLWEYLGTKTPEVIEAIKNAPPKKQSKKKFRIKPIKKYYPKFRPANVKRKKAEKSVLSYDMLPPDSYKAKQLAKKLEKKLNAESQENPE